MKTPVFDESHPLWDTFIKFHTGQFSGEARASAKALLFGIHYGSYDTKRAYQIADAKRKKGKT